MITHPSISIIVGVCEGGKSHMLKYLLYELGCSTPIDMIHLYSRSLYSAASEAKNGKIEQYDYIPKQWQHSDFQLSSLKNIERLQRRCLRQNGKAPKTVIIYDDGFSRQNEAQDFIKIINKFRHSNISIIVSLQYLASNISTNFRAIADYCFIFRADDGAALRANYDALIRSAIPDLREYEKFNNSLPEYHCFYVRKKKKSYEIVIAPAELPDYEFIYRKEIKL